MEEKTVYVGIFWALPNESDGGWNFYEVKKSYPISAANALGFIDYPFSHYDKWDDVHSHGETDDCYFYPRGRVIYNVNIGNHRVFADRCLDEYAMQDIIELFEIENYELCRDEHYVSAFTEKRHKAVTSTLEYKILRGKEKIGENLIEFTYGKTKILAELGKALKGGTELSDLEKIVLKTNYNAVIVSHYHADHAGLIVYKKDCPIYIGCGAYRIIKAMNEYQGNIIGKNIITYRSGKPFTVGDIKVTPYLCDHSAFDSHMLLFEAGGKSILYTGDFRFHGRKDKGKLLAQLPHKINTLICEGTNIGNNKLCFSESDLENGLDEIIEKSDKPVFVLQSSSNIDRLVSVYRAAKRNGRILYEDNYTAMIASAAGRKIPRPDVFKDVYAFTKRVFLGYLKDMFFELDYNRGITQIAKNNKFVMFVRPSMIDYIKKLADKMDLAGAIMIYSLWNGYKENNEMKEFLTAIEEMGIQIKTLHTSGHASAEDIKLLEQSVSADEYVIVHTENNIAKLFAI